MKEGKIEEDTSSLTRTILATVPQCTFRAVVPDDVNVDDCEVLEVTIRLEKTPNGVDASLTTVSLDDGRRLSSKWMVDGEQ